MNRRSRRAAYLTVVIVLLVALGATAITLQRRHAHQDACDDWQELLDRRTAENTALVGAQTAKQFRREALSSGRIDLGGRSAQRPANC